MSGPWRYTTNIRHSRPQGSSKPTFTALSPRVVRSTLTAPTGDPPLVIMIFWRYLLAKYLLDSIKTPGYLSDDSIFTSWLKRWIVFHASSGPFGWKLHSFRPWATTLSPVSSSQFITMFGTLDVIAFDYLFIFKIQVFLKNCKKTHKIKI